MRYQRFGDRYMLRLDSGEPVLQTLLGFLDTATIPCANVSATGGVNRVRLAHWNEQTGEYDVRTFTEQLEVLGFQGNAAMKGGAPYLSLEGVFGRADFSVIGGHVAEAWVHPTLEVWFRTEGVGVMRRHDDASGLDLLDLPNVPRATRIFPSPEGIH